LLQPLKLGSQAVFQDAAQKLTSGDFRNYDFSIVAAPPLNRNESIQIEAYQPEFPF
jgi:hypothetical protein